MDVPFINHSHGGTHGSLGGYQIMAWDSSMAGAEGAIHLCLMRIPTFGGVPQL